MKLDKLNEYRDQLNELAHTLENDAGSIDVWYARDIQKVLDYARWDKFKNVIEKAEKACENASQSISDHFSHVGKMVKLGSDTTREIQDIMLTRYACYMIAQNADSSKEIVAFAQSYFAVQTRLNELNDNVLSERVKSDMRLQARQKLREAEKGLSDHVFAKGLPDASFARIRSKGDTALFGLSTSEMKERLKIPKNRPLADFLPRVVVAGKAFATELTNANIESKSLGTEQEITFEHIKHNSNVRKLLLDSNIRPENLPKEEDIKKLERRLKGGDKKALKELNQIIEKGK